MKKVLNRICLCLIGMIICLGEYDCVYATEPINVQTYVDEEQAWIYIPSDYEQIDKISVQIGKESVDDVKVKHLLDVEECYIDTVILFDNSFSISAKNREKMKAIAKGLIQNHVEKEIFTLATFDTEIRDLSVDSTDYEDMQKQIDDIVFMNQDTYLRNSLYEVFSERDLASKAYQKIVVLSDGSDDNEVGYTYDEMRALLTEKKFQIYSIGSRYEGNISALEEMFSLSRVVGSQFFLLDEIEDPSFIVEQISDENPRDVVCFDIPDSLKDGSEQNIKIELEMNGVQHVILAKARMPFINIHELPEHENLIESLPQTNIADTVEDLKEESNQKSSIGGIIWIIVLIIIVVLGGVAILVYYNKKKKEKVDKSSNNSLSESSEYESDEEDEATVLMQEYDDSTILMKIGDGSETIKEPLKVILTEEYNRSNVLQCECYTQVVVGRNETCDIVIRGDKSVSGKHCIIFVDFEGKLAIRDNASSNGTYINSEKLYGERKLIAGDVLEIGRTRYKVDIVGE